MSLSRVEVFPYAAVWSAQGTIFARFRKRERSETAVFGRECASRLRGSRSASHQQASLQPGEQREADPVVAQEGLETGCGLAVADPPQLVLQQAEGDRHAGEPGRVGHKSQAKHYQ